MSYPWPSIGTFIFTREETALDGLGGQWSDAPSEARSRAAGAVTDTIVLLAIGSPTREFACMLAPERFAELRGHLYASVAFTDWERPVPNARQVRLDAVVNEGSVAVLCSDGQTRRRIRTRIRLTGF